MWAPWLVGLCACGLVACGLVAFGFVRSWPWACGHVGLWTRELVGAGLLGLVGLWALVVSWGELKYAPKLKSRVKVPRG